MSDYKIAIVNSSSFGTWFPDHIKRLKAIGPVKFFTVPSDLPGKELAFLLSGYNLIISSVTPFFTKEFFDASEGLLLISRHGIGYNNIDVQAAKEKGVIVTIVPPLVERDAVAENAVTNLLNVMRRTIPAAQAAAANKWVRRASFMGNNLSNKTAGVIGCGNIGSRVAEIIRYGFNARVLVNDPNLDQEWADKHGMEQVDLPTLLRESDVISLNASLNEGSKEVLNEQAFSLMKRGVYITNTARGALVNERALLKALDLEIVAGLATDVMWDEPSYNTHPYFAYERILVTPHTSAYTFECLEGMGDKCVSDVECVVQGKQPQQIVTG